MKACRKCVKCMCLIDPPVRSTECVDCINHPIVPIFLTPDSGPDMPDPDDFAFNDASGEFHQSLLINYLNIRINSTASVRQFRSNVAV